MSGEIRTAAEMLSAALDDIDEVPTYTDPSLPVSPPCTVLGPPQVRWEDGNPAPSSARFLIYVVENQTAGAIERLWDLLPIVAQAIDANTTAVVDPASGALPGVYIAAGTQQLPCYELVVEVPLNG
jgi:hypothetical protein